MSNYYDIEDILCEEQWFTIKIKQEIYHGGFLDSEFGKPDDNLQPEQKIRVPLWIAQNLYKLKNQEKECCQIDIPEMFSESFQKALQSDPDVKIVNLKNQSNYFYELGVKMIGIAPHVVEQEQFQGSLKLSKVIKQALVKRCQNIMEYSLLSYIENSVNILRSLCSFETRVFNIGREQQQQYGRWRDESINRRRKPYIAKRIKQ